MIDLAITHNDNNLKSIGRALHRVGAATLKAITFV